MGGHSPVNSENKVLLQIYVLENVNMTCFFRISQSIRVINVTLCYTAYGAYK